jgi:hypothetical protein
MQTIRTATTAAILTMTTLATPRISIIQKAGTGGDRTRTADREATTKTNTVRDRSLYPYPAINRL